MTAYILRRLLLMIPTMIGIMWISFIVIQFAPGGPVDTTARVFAKYLGDKLGQTVVVENRAGASGMIASDATAKATPDGYLLGFAASPTLTMSPLVQRSKLFDPRSDFSLIGLVVDYANVLLIGPPGTAKSALARRIRTELEPAIAERLLAQPDLLRLSCTVKDGDLSIN